MTRGDEDLRYNYSLLWAFHCIPEIAKWRENFIDINLTVLGMLIEWKYTQCTSQGGILNSTIDIPENIHMYNQNLLTLFSELAVEGWRKWLSTQTHIITSSHGTMILRSLLKWSLRACTTTSLYSWCKVWREKPSQVSSFTLILFLSLSNTNLLSFS